jgi:hypothetical protein
MMAVADLVPNANLLWDVSVCQKTLSLPASCCVCCSAGPLMELVIHAGITDVAVPVVSVSGKESSHADALA